MSNFWKNFGTFLDAAITAGAIYQGNSWINNQAERINNESTQVKAMIEVAHEIASIDGDTWNALHTGLLAKSINNSKVELLKNYCIHVVNIETGHLNQILKMNLNEGTSILLDIFQRGTLYDQCAYLGILKAYGNNVKASYLLNNLIDNRNQSTNYVGRAQASGAFNKIWLEFNLYSGDIKGMDIHVDFSISGCRERSCKLLVWFYQGNGNKLKDFNEKYTTTDGQVCVSRTFQPKYDDTRFEDFTIFMPYDELHVNVKGTHEIKFIIGMFVGHDLLIESQFTSFDFTLS